MQNVYACRLDVPAEQTDSALGVAAKWLWRGGANPDQWEELSAEAATDEGRATRTSREEHATGELWDATLTHPHHDDGSVTVVARIEILSQEGKPTSFLNTIELRRDEGDLQPIRVPINAPRLTREVLSECESVDGGRRLAETPVLLQAKDVSAFAEFLFNPERRLPVVLATYDTRLDARYIDEDKLAIELAGLAHVFFTDYGLPANELTSEVGQDLSAWGGAVRIWWPGVTPSSGRYENPLFVPRRLTRADGAPNLGVGTHRVKERIWRVASDSMFQPASHREVKRAIRVSHLKGARDASEYAEELEKAWDERDAAEARSAALQAKADRLERELEAVREQFGVYETAQKTDLPTVEEEVYEPSSVADAVQYAAGRFRNLEFTPQAHKSAGECPFVRPNQILEGLGKLNELAGLEKRDGGSGKRRDKAAEELGLQWRSDVGDGARGKHSEKYTVLWREEKVELGPHINFGSGRGAASIARVYFYCHEAEDPSERCFVIGHVGRHLPDSTTG
jgi:hypothetical protein